MLYQPDPPLHCKQYRPYAALLLFKTEEWGRFFMT